MILRNPNKEDLRGLHKIQNRAQYQFWTIKQIEEEIVQNHVASLVVEDARGLLGYILFRGEGMDLELMSIAVDPPCQRMGLGKKLFLSAIENLKIYRVYGAGLKIHLEVSAKNNSAISFYNSLGFVKQRVRQAYYPDGSDAFEMLFQEDGSSK